MNPRENLVFRPTGIGDTFRNYYPLDSLNLFSKNGSNISVFRKIQIFARHFEYPGKYF